MRRKKLEGVEKVAAEMKLPRWAQDELASLRSRLRERTRQVLQFSMGLEEDAACIVLDPYSECPVRLPLQRVEVRLGKTANHRERTVEVIPAPCDRNGQYGDTSKILVRIATSNPMRVIPHVSNVVSIGDE